MSPQPGQTFGVLNRWLRYAFECLRTLAQPKLIGALLAATVCMTAKASAQRLQFEADNWVAECGAAADSDCSIIGVFRSANTGPTGSFSLLVDLRNRMVAIVGKPSPTRASIRIDKNPALECRGDQYCIFSTIDAEAIAHQLKLGSLALIDVVAGKDVFQASISTKGYQADLGKIRAQGFRNLMYD